jgi:hypothetical protein
MIDHNFFQQTGNICLASSLIFVCIAIFDYYWFTYHPLMRNLAINVNNRHSARRDQLEQIINNSDQMPEFEGRVFVREQNVYAVLDNSRSKGNSFRSLFGIKELLLLLISTALS